ncbi:MAG: nitroreductase family protein [Sphaerochaeta sp.]|jgi:nitroreductase|nr:nitroreductase family protein [Sphaerochaeta sp.]MCH3920889.1 nitroreductase family protein [Sphaerochaeta sp.]MCI2045216.1 nitroreductase family protein [Sphaerochaeta sp.]MCI2076664.1 nitroreductase family protein [Sphaerochaeta sp.]MCI2096697.1 nitroreductase family protein [Sphaerochaeta sp.]
MTVEEAIHGRRMIRKFLQEPIPKETLLRLVDAARLAPSAANLQPLRYRIVNDPKEVGAMFPLVHWAAYIAPNGNPKEGERPVAYIVLCADTTVKKEGYDTDAGMAAENLILLAESMGIGVCVMGAIDRKAIHALLHLDEHIVIHTVLALGKKGEHPVLEEMTDSVKYYKDAQGTLHVPKRKLTDILL